MHTIKSNSIVRRPRTIDEMIACDWARYKLRRVGLLTFGRPLRSNGPWRYPGHKSFNHKPRRYTGPTFGR